MRVNSSAPSRRATSYHLAVLGAGSFGTALADIAATNGHQVKLWARSSEQAQHINSTHTNPRYLPGINLHPAVSATTELSAALAGATIVLIAIPSAYFRAVVRQVAPLLSRETIIVSTTKGIEPATFALMSQILAEELTTPHIGVLSGPNLAKEIANKAITATVIASHDQALYPILQNVLHCHHFKVYANPDVYGVELAGALKNIYAIAAGIGMAMGMGENTKSLLITRSLAEMSRFAVPLGANPLTFLGLAGVGDLIATCTSTLSRNVKIGYALGQGQTLAEAERALGQVAEGINTLQQVKVKAETLGVYMPLVHGLYQTLFAGGDIQVLIQEMMQQEQKTDVEFVMG